MLKSEQVVELLQRQGLLHKRVADFGAPSLLLSACLQILLDFQDVFSRRCTQVRIRKTSLHATCNAARPNFMPKEVIFAGGARPVPAAGALMEDPSAV